MAKDPVIILASNNEGKFREIQRLLPSWVTIRTAAEAGVDVPEETGTTFVENALIKAREAAHQAGAIAVADDSGLEVDALGGLPGVRSARFAGEHATDTDNNSLLLERLKTTPATARTARFRSVVAIVTPSGEEMTTEGMVEGVILESPRGTGGFGYDPLFVPIGLDRTMAELSIDEKNLISHRGRAFRKAAELLQSVLKSESEFRA